eukprot:scaffold12893_cov94-Isochrysis_galbana.AAC.7
MPALTPPCQRILPVSEAPLSSLVPATLTLTLTALAHAPAPRTEHKRMLCVIDRYVHNNPSACDSLPAAG